MRNITIQARIDPELKSQAEAVFASIGLKTSDAIRMFLKQSVNKGGLPFRPEAKIPNNATIAAMAEIEQGDYQEFKNVDELFSDLDKAE